MPLRMLWMTALLGLAGCTYVYYPASPQPADASPSAGTVSPANCREFTQTVLIEGKPVQAVGHACRQQDGSWRIM
jgi:hypothetical protein